MHYYTVPNDGRFAVVYNVPGTFIHSVVEDCPTERSAKTVANRMNDDYARSQKYYNPDVYERRLVSGFYTNEDAR